MLQSGGEVSRVEDTIGRILKTYGCTRVDVFTITSEIQVTAVDETEHVYTQVRRIYNWGTDLEVLEQLNQLSRDICAHRYSISEISEKIKNCVQKKEIGREIFVYYVGSVLAASAFTLFFGGGIFDALATAVLACLITWANRYITSRRGNRLLYYFLVSTATGFAGHLLVMLGSRLGFFMDLDKILIGCVMLSIPGIAITYSVRDMLLGETITGLLRFVESVLITISIAGGYILAALIAGGTWL